MSPPCFADDPGSLDGKLAEPSSTPAEGVSEWRRRLRGELLAARLAVPVAERARAAATVAATLDELIPSGPLGVWVPVVLGVIFVLCVVVIRRGIVGESQAWMQRRR